MFESWVSVLIEIVKFYVTRSLIMEFDVGQINVLTYFTFRRSRAVWQRV